jgi:benzoate transport
MDPRSIVKSGSMTPFQVVVVALCVLIAALDGFDVLVIAYTVPSIAHDWSLSPASLGAVFSAGLLGMGLGGAFIAPIADRFGRRPVIMLSLAIMAAGMLAAAFAENITQLAIVRIFTGVGIGSALASVNVVVTEYSSDRRRSLAISLMTIGYPVGATLGGFISIYLINLYGWRSVYIFGAAVAVVLIPLAMVWIPESIDYLIAREPVDARQKIGRILMRMGHKPPDEWLARFERVKTPKIGLLSIFQRPHLASTLASSLSYFSLTFTVYFLLSWMPRLLTELGFSVAGGISGSLLMNISGVLGCILFGCYAKAVGARILSGIVMVGLFLAMLIFGVTPPNPTALLASTLAVGFFLFTSVTALYVVVPTAFPSTVRSTATGFAMSIGRIGAMAGPLVGGLLIGSGWSRAAYCVTLAAPMLAAAIGLFWIRSEGTDVIPTDERMPRYLETEGTGAKF